MIGRPVKIQHGLETTVSELNALEPNKRNKLSQRFKRLYEKAPIYLILDSGRLVVAHAGIQEKNIGSYSKQVKSFVLYGDTTGQIDKKGFPERKDWARHYRGEPWVIYGHTPLTKPRIINHTANIDTGCVFGGALTAFRYPEMTTISVPSEQPFQPERFRDE
jgi:protein phosphatase